MYTLEGKIKGIVPILFNRPPAPAPDGGHGPRTKGKEQDLQPKVHRDANGLYLPASNLKMAITGADTSRGAAMIVGSEIESKKGRAYIDWCKACLFVQPSRLYFGKDTWDFVDERWGKNKEKHLIWLERPALKEGWELKFSLMVVEDEAKPDWVKRFFEVAGLRVGVGSYRPEFGRFQVEWL